MLMSFPVRAVVVALVLAGLAGCSSKKTAIYEHENFDDSGTSKPAKAIWKSASTLCVPMMAVLSITPPCSLTRCRTDTH